MKKVGVSPLFYIFFSIFDNFLFFYFSIFVI